MASKFSLAVACKVTGVPASTGLRLACSVTAKLLTSTVVVAVLVQPLSSVAVAEYTVLATGRTVIELPPSSCCHDTLFPGEEADSVTAVPLQTFSCRSSYVNTRPAVDQQPAPVDEQCCIRSGGCL